MENLKLGAFSISLNVKNIHHSKEFYEKLGFKVMGGNIDQNWLILKNENTVIGLFQGMFNENLLTFNPGWNQNAENLEDYDDIRTIQHKLKSSGIELISEVDSTTTGPAHFMIKDPDGNTILFDQHR